MSLGYYNVSFLKSVKDLILLAEMPSQGHYNALYGIVRLEQIYGPLARSLLLDDRAVRYHNAVVGCKCNGYASKVLPGMASAVMETTSPFFTRV